LPCRETSRRARIVRRNLCGMERSMAVRTRTDCASNPRYWSFDRTTAWVVGSYRPVGVAPVQLGTGQCAAVAQGDLFGIRDQGSDRDDQAGHGQSRIRRAIEWLVRGGPPAANTPGQRLVDPDIEEDIRLNRERLTYIDHVLDRQQAVLREIYHSPDPVTIRVRGER
jgi:hypothetical protein